MYGPATGVTFAVLMLGAACGRIGFDTADTVGGHDEDADGVEDAGDPCPHLPGPHADTDGDGVGDDCDPEPQLARQRIALFVSFAEAHPFDVGADGVWTQDADELVNAGGKLAELDLPMHFDGALRVALGADLVAIGPPNLQHQLALHVKDDTRVTQFFGELNELPGLSVATITRFDGSYVRLAEQALVSGVHPGSVFLQLTYRLDAMPPTLELDGGWPGELYAVSAPITAYTRGRVSINLNNLDLRVRYVVLIETTP